jgi:hypothetical protein
MTTPIAVGERVRWREHGKALALEWNHLMRTQPRTSEQQRRLNEINGELARLVGQLTRIEGEPSSRVVDGAGDEEVVG